MKIEWLEDFLCLADTRSFSRSVADRNVTQPAFSRRIRALETFLSAPLIDKVTFPTTLALAGEAFRRTAEEVIRMIERDRETFRAQVRDDQRALLFAGLHNLTVTFYPQWLASVERSLGPLRTRVVSENMHDCAERLTSGHYDFMLVHAHEAVPIAIDPVSFPSVKLATDALVPVSVPKPGNEPRFKLPGSPETPVPHLSYTTEQFMGVAEEFICLQYDKPLYLEVKYENTFVGALKAMALVGHGLAWLPESSIVEELKDGRLVKAGGPDFELAMNVRLYRSIHTTHPMSASLWEHVKAMELIQSNAEDGPSC